MRYEHKNERLAPKPVYYRRLFVNFLLAMGILGISLLIGVLGYRYFAEALWIDSFHNACMILSGMGPVIAITTTSGKVFSSIYALFSGVVFITNIGLIIAPAVHRFFHKLHLQEK